MKSIEASQKRNEQTVISNLQNKQQKRQPIAKSGDLVRTADIKKVFIKGDMTNWSYRLYTISGIIHDTIPPYGISKLYDKFNENKLKPSKLTLRENNGDMKDLQKIQ